MVAFATGLLDDIFGLKPSMKMLGQVFAAALACNANVLIDGMGAHAIGGAWWQVPLTIFWLVGCTNAFNVIDGLDGLAAGLGLIATTAAFLSGLLTHNLPLAFLTAPLLGALLGFLPYNFSPASVFMGDCGSLTVGFLLGCFGVIWSRQAASLPGMTAPLIAMAIPLLDTTLTISRRFLRGHPIFAGDLGHIHHRLLGRGFAPRQVLCLVSAFAAVLATLSLLVGNAQIGGIVMAVFFAVIWFAVRRLGYEEFKAARRLLFGGFRRILNANVSVARFEQSIRSAHTVDECWQVLLTAGRTFGLSSATLRLPGRNLTATLIECSPAESWSFRIPLDGAGHVELSVPFHPDQATPAIDPFVTSVRRVLAPRLVELESRTSDLVRTASTSEKS